MIFSEITRDSSRNTSPRLPVRNMGAAFSGMACRCQKGLPSALLPTLLGHPLRSCIPSVRLQAHRVFIRQFQFMQYPQAPFLVLGACGGQNLQTG